jgi:hypothetical protein
MKDIRDYLKYDFFRYGDEKDSKLSEFIYDVEIREVKENPYYLPFGDKGVHHWEMVINVLHHNHRYDDEDDNTAQLMTENGPLLFKMTSYSIPPNIENFSTHIYQELRAVLQALELTDKFVWEFPEMLDRHDITPKMVYKFLKNIHKDYTKTEDFLKDYDHYVERIYHDYKFMSYLCFGVHYMFAMGWEYPIGEHLLAFLDIGKWRDHYKKNY